MSEKSKRKDLWRYLLLLSVMVILAGKSLTNENTWYYDSDRIAMDGVYMMDAMKDLPLKDIWRYTCRYYAQYPALSVGYKPTFFPFVEAIFYSIFGVSLFSAKLAVLFFGLVAVGVLYLLVKRIYDEETALYSSLFFITTPFIVQWLKVTMLEVPFLAMVILTVYLFYLYCESGRLSYAYLLAITFSLTVWTKQTGIFLILLFIPYILLKKKQHLFFRKEHIVIYLIPVFFLTLLAVLTLKLGSQNLAQSIGATGLKASRFSGENLLKLLKILYRHHLMLLVLILSIAGLLSAIIRKDRKADLFLLWILSNYIFFTFIHHKNPRYSICWIPPLSLFAALSIYGLKKKLPQIHLILIPIVIFQFMLSWRLPPSYATGYEEAVRYVAGRTDGHPIFFHGRGNGPFIFFVRKLDVDRKLVVLRSDKMIASGSIVPTHWTKIHIKNTEDIYRIFNDFGVRYVIAEDREDFNLEIFKLFWEVISSEKFVLEKTISFKNNLTYKSKNILIYRYKEEHSPKKNTILRLRLPVVGQEINIPMESLVNYREEEKATDD